MFTSVHLCTFVDVFQIVVLFSIFLVPLFLYVLFGLTARVASFDVSCLSYVSSLSFNEMIRRIWNPLWNCHTALIHSSGLIPSIFNTVSFRFYSLRIPMPHSILLLLSIQSFAESLESYSCHCKSCRYSIPLKLITYVDSLYPSDSGFNVAELDSVVSSSVVYFVLNF